jgi:hypothetical protein
MGALLPERVLGPSTITVLEEQVDEHAFAVVARAT